jgi:hypothetical protein
MVHGTLSPSAIRIVLAGMGAVVIVACGSDVAPVSAPEPVSALAPADGGGSVAASAVSTESCEVVGPSGYTLTFAGGTSSLSASGNETLQCRGSVTPAPGQTEFYSGFPCYLPQTGDWTSRSYLTLLTNGGASLKCQAK